MGARFLREAAALEASYLADARADRAPAFYADGFLSDEALEELQRELMQSWGLCTGSSPPSSPAPKGQSQGPAGHAALGGVQ